MRTIIVNGEAGLSLAFPRSSLKGAAGAMAASLSEEGSLVAAAARREPWRFESIEEGEDETRLIGPRFEGRSLDSGMGVEDGLQLLREAARALEFLSREGHLPRGVVSTGILIGDDGAVLVLPATAVARALAARGPDARAAAAARLVHPRSASAEADAAFLVAQAAYRFASGSAPFPREAADTSNSAPPSPPVLRAALAAPALDPTLAALIDRTLADPGSAPLLEWRVALDEAAERGWLRTLDPEEESEIARERDATVEKARRKEVVSTFFRKRGVLLGSVAAVAAFLAVLTVSTIQARNDGPDLSGRTPRQVAQAYYLAIDGLDIETIDAAADKKASAADSTVVTNLYIMTRTRFAYEGIDSMTKASQWLEAKRPPLDPGEVLFGVTDLELEDDGSLPSEEIGARYSVRASYSLWYIEREEDGGWGSTARVVEDKRIDDLVLERKEKSWKIVELSRRPG